MACRDRDYDGDYGTRIYERHTFCTEDCCFKIVTVIAPRERALPQPDHDEILMLRHAATLEEFLHPRSA